MSKILFRVWPIAGLIVDVLLIIDIASELVKKYNDRKNKETSPEPATSES